MICIRILFLALVVLMTSYSCSSDKETGLTSNDWSEYLGGPDRNHFSTLDQITTKNVNQLTKAWEYHTKDSGQLQCNPIIVNGVLYAMTASVQPFALDAPYW